MGWGTGNKINAEEKRLLALIRSNTNAQKKIEKLMEQAVKELKKLNK